jgi:hypothetical protein
MCLSDLMNKFKQNEDTNLNVYYLYDSFGYFMILLELIIFYFSRRDFVSPLYWVHVTFG